MLASKAVANALHAFVEIGGGGAARLNADHAALWLHLLEDFRDVGADLVIVRPDIGNPQILVLRQNVGIEGEHRDAGFLGGLQRRQDRHGIGRRHGNAGDAFGDEILHDLHLLVTAAVFARADILALECVA